MQTDKSKEESDQSSRVELELCSCVSDYGIWRAKYQQQSHNQRNSTCTCTRLLLSRLLVLGAVVEKRNELCALINSNLQWQYEISRDRNEARMAAYKHIQKLSNMLRVLLDLLLELLSHEAIKAGNLSENYRQTLREAVPLC